jgi:hypothetical protein
MHWPKCTIWPWVLADNQPDARCEFGLTQSLQQLVFSNIVTEPIGGLWQECFEGAFLQEYFEQLQLLLGDDFRGWKFHLLHHNLAVLPLKLPSFGKGHVLIWFSDESSGPADDAARKFEYVFKCYALPKPCSSNVYPFPLFGCSAVLGQRPLPIADRKHDVFFSGNLNRNRVGLFLRLTFPAFDQLPSIPLGTRTQRCLAAACRLLNALRLRQASLASSFIQFNHGFARGLPPKDYAAQLARAKICLCPPGFITNETIRHFEAMSLGCVVLSELLPPSPFYQGSPIFQFPGWRGVRQKIISLLHDQQQLAQVSSNTQAWWREYCSPKAAARQTATVLRNGLRTS